MGRVLLAAVIIASLALPSPAGPPTMTRLSFGRMPNGTTVDAYALANGRGVEARVMTYGASLISLRTPDRDGRIADIVLGFVSLDDYLVKSRYFGSTVGRYGNRIANGRFPLDGRTIQLTVNNGPHHL